MLRWIQIGTGELPTFDEQYKTWLLQDERIQKVRQAAERTGFSAFSTEDDE